MRSRNSWSILQCLLAYTYKTVGQYCSVFISIQQPSGTNVAMSVSIPALWLQEQTLKFQFIPFDLHSLLHSNLNLQFLRFFTVIIRHVQSHCHITPVEVCQALEKKKMMLLFHFHYHKRSHIRLQHVLILSSPASTIPLIKP